MNKLTDLVSTDPFRFIVLAKDRFIAPALKYYGEYAAEETEMLARFLNPDGIVLDIGANIGTHTLAFANKVPEGEVWSFEPQKFVYQILCGNIALNGLPNVRAFHCAVGRESGHIGVPFIDYETPDNYGGLDLRKYGGAAADQYDQTPMIALDSLNLAEVDLIKIDVDGMEEEVLRGAFQTLFRCKPILYVESDRMEQRSGLIGFLNTLGYRIWEHRPALIKKSAEARLPIESETDPEIRKTLSELKTYMAINFLCLPKEFGLVEEDWIREYDLKPISS